MNIFTRFFVTRFTTCLRMVVARYGLAGRSAVSKCIS